ncbi:hypothetical protein PENTCL1PPCAC_28237, partial [Pristionchus entomophagus]
FINQKRNHTEITVNVECHSNYPPVFVEANGELRQFSQLQLAFCGVKDDDPSTQIEIAQCEAVTRKPFAFDPVPFRLETLCPRKVEKVVVPRLQFEKATDGNNTNPSSKQKYYRMVVRLIAVTAENVRNVVQSYISDRFIVR